MKTVISVTARQNRKSEEKYLRPNYIGILGAIIAFISLALPWWTLTLSSTIAGISTSLDANLYLYQIANNVTGFTLANTWYAWGALILVIIAALLALTGSVIEKGRMMLIGGGALTILAIIIFAVGLMMDLSGSVGIIGLGLFSSGSISYGEFGSMAFSTYLSYGFWLALVAAITMFAASAWKPKEAAAVPPTPTPTS